MFTFDPYSWDLQDNPYPAYKVLRDEYPAYFAASRNLWVITRYADCLAALQSHALWSSASGNTLDTAFEQSGQSLGSSDPPRHEQMRRLITKVFTPTSVARLEPFIRQSARQLVNAFIEDGQCDFTEQFAARLTASVLGFLLGIPPSDHELLRSWSDAIVHHPEDGSIPVERAQYLKKLFNYIAQLVRQRRETPREDLISGLAATEDAGAHLSDGEICTLCAGLIGAAFESTNLMIGNALVALFLHPEQRLEVRHDPSLVPAMIEESLRWDSSLQGFGRVATRDIVMEGQLIPKGERAFLVLGSGNRDERQFPDPDRFDIHRKIERHLGFGWGIHICLGAPLARLEMKVAFEEVLPRMGDYEVDLEHARRVRFPQLRGYQVLPVRFLPQKKLEMEEREHESQTQY